MAKWEEHGILHERLPAARKARLAAESTSYADRRVSQRQQRQANVARVSRGNHELDTDEEDAHIGTTDDDDAGEWEEDEDALEGEEDEDALEGEEYDEDEDEL